MPSLLAHTAKYDTIYLRIALAASFIAAVTDRFGVWGSPGTTNVAWGDWSHFLAYAAVLNPELPRTWIPTLGWIVTLAELALATALLVGYHTRSAAFLAALLLLGFAVGMTIGTGVKSALNASVFSASAGALLLARGPTYPWSVDAWRAGRGASLGGSPVATA